MSKPFLQRYSVFTLFAVALTLILLIQAVSLWANLSGNQPATKSRNSPQSNLDYNINSITQRSLFGPIGSSGNAGFNAPTLQSDFVLQGIFMATEAANSSVIIAPPGKSSGTYRVNDSLSDSLTVHSIEKDRVVVDNNGQLESIVFPEPGQSNPSGQLGGNINTEDYSQLLSTLSADEQSELIKNVKAGDVQGLMQALPQDKKLEIVQQRLDQLRNQSSKSR